MGAFESLKSQTAVLPSRHVDAIQFNNTETVEIVNTPVIPRFIAGFICHIGDAIAKSEATNRVVKYRSMKVHDRVATFDG